MKCWTTIVHMEPTVLSSAEQQVNPLLYQKKSTWNASKICNRACQGKNPGDRRYPVPTVPTQRSRCPKEAVEDGADGLLLVTPYYNQMYTGRTDRTLYRCCKEAKAPIILYSVASRTGVNIAPETVAALHENIENIVAVKEASGNNFPDFKDHAADRWQDRSVFRQ